MNHPALTLLSDLLDVPSPSGREAAIATIIRQKLDELGVAHETDAIGNVLVRLNGRNPDAPLTIFASHMDEIGFVVQKIEADGTLRVGRTGGLLPWKLGESPVEIVGDVENIVGVVSMGSTHGGTFDKPITWQDTRILTGLSPAQLAAKGVRVGSTGAPIRAHRGPVVFGDEADPLVGAWTFDDRAGCMTLLRLLERFSQESIVPPRPLMLAFTVREEVGGHGAKHLAISEKPEIFVSVDGAPMPAETDLKLDGRSAIWSKDRLAHYDQDLLQDFHRAAKNAGVGLQTAVYEGAASDASLLHYAGLAPRIACIGHVRENSHGYEVIRLSVLDNLLDILVSYCKS